MTAKESLHQPGLETVFKDTCFNIPTSSGDMLRRKEHTPYRGFL